MGAAVSYVLSYIMWKEWTEDNPPECNYILQSWDTAYTVKSTSDYSAVTTWGIFEHNGIQNAILLSARRERWEFPELKSEAIKLYNEFRPDVVLIEAKASGWSLIQELQRAGIPITPFNPKRADKKNRNKQKDNVNTHWLKSICSSDQCSNKLHKNSKLQYILYPYSEQCKINSLLICEYQWDRIEVEWI